MMNPEVIQIFKELGFPVVVAFGALWFIAKSTIWFGDKILLPIKERLLIHLDIVDRFLGKAPDSLMKIEQALEKQSEHLQLQTDYLQEQSRSIEEQSMLLKRVEQHLSAQ